MSVAFLLLCWENSERIGVWAAMASSPLSVVHSGGGCGCFMPGRRTLARDRNVCSRQHPPTRHLHATFLRDYMFLADGSLFLSREQSCTADVLSLVAMGTGTDEDVSRFSGCLRLCTRARVSVSPQPVDASEWTYTVSMYAHVRAEGHALCKGCICARGAESAGAFSLPGRARSFRRREVLWRKVSAAPRTDRSRRHSNDPAAAIVMYLALWRRSGAHFTAY